MGRIRGSFITSNNYEVKKTAPFDARMLVKKKSDLTDPSSWSIAGSYNGMIVAVGNDLWTVFQLAGHELAGDIGHDHGNGGDMGHDFVDLVLQAAVIGV